MNSCKTSYFLLLLPITTDSTEDTKMFFGNVVTKHAELWDVLVCLVSPRRLVELCLF